MQPDDVARAESSANASSRDKPQRSSILREKERRLRARRAERRAAHDAEMEMRINETLETTRRALEAFCETHFVGAGDNDTPDGGKKVGDKGVGPLGRGAASLVTTGTQAGVKTRENPRSRSGDRFRTDAWISFCRVCSGTNMDPLLLYHSLAFKNNPSHEEKYLSALSVAILDVCDAQENLTGGLCALENVVARVRRRGGSWVAGRGAALVRDDVVRAVESMRVGLDMSGGRESSVGIVTVNGVMYVSTADIVLDEECMQLLNVFERVKEGVTRRECMDLLRWAEERVVDAMGKLMREGVVWLDDPGDGCPLLYWCPSMS